MVIEFFKSSCCSSQVVIHWISKFGIVIMRIVVVFVAIVGFVIVIGSVIMLWYYLVLVFMGFLSCARVFVSYVFGLVCLCLVHRLSLVRVFCYGMNK
jgi:hypothetical protein